MSERASSARTARSSRKSNRLRKSTTASWRARTCWGEAGSRSHFASSPGLRACAPYRAVRTANPRQRDRGRGNRGAMHSGTARPLPRSHPAIVNARQRPLVIGHGAGTSLAPFEDTFMNDGQNEMANSGATAQKTEMTLAARPDRSRPGLRRPRRAWQSPGCDAGFRNGLVWFGRLRAAEDTHLVDHRSVPGQDSSWSPSYAGSATASVANELY